MKKYLNVYRSSPHGQAIMSDEKGNIVGQCECGLYLTLLEDIIKCRCGRCYNNSGEQTNNIVFVDIDDTLIDGGGHPIRQIVDAVRKHIKNKDIIYAWSQGGADYACEEFKKVIGIYPKRTAGKAEQEEYPLSPPDICYDDQPESVKEQAEWYGWDLSKIEIVQPTQFVD